MRTPRLDRSALEAARTKLLPDVVAPGLSIVFSGINPGLMSAATGWHFARPGNRFWPALHQSGLTPRLLRPSEQRELLTYGLGITNVAPRATPRADELTVAELRAGGVRLRELAERYEPRWIAVVGVTAYRTAFARPQATFGEQPETLGPARLWVLPNPSGLNAHFTQAKLSEAFASLATAAVAT